MGVVIGLIGDEAAGKGTFIGILRMILEELFPGIKISVVSNDLHEDAEITILNSTEVVVIYDSVQSIWDLKMIGRQRNHLLVHITADSRIRYDRVRRRAEERKEVMTFDQFRQSERALTKVGSSELRVRGLSVVGLENNDSLHEFKNLIERFVMRKLLPCWKKIESTPRPPQ